MLTAERYQKLIMNLISPLEVDEQRCWLQQDGGYGIYSKFNKTNVE
jgi:hypothetical protein